MKNLIGIHEQCIDALAAISGIENQIRLNEESKIMAVGFPKYIKNYDEKIKNLQEELAEKVEEYKNNFSSLNKITENGIFKSISSINSSTGCIVSDGR